MSNGNAEQAIELAEHLLHLLEVEASVLGEQDLERLQSLPGKKQSLLDRLEQQQALLADGTTEQLAKLRHILEQCQIANQHNGRVIHSQQVSNKSLLAILRGGDRHSTYAPPGGRSDAPSVTLRRV